MKLVQNLIAALFSMLVLGAATAAPMSDTIDENPNINIGGVGNPSSFTFTHNLLDQPFQPYVKDVDTISSAKLTITLQDTGGTETFDFIVGPTGFTETFSGANIPNGLSFHPNSLSGTVANLSATGMLSVTILAKSGTFRFDNSLLEVEVTRGVPEPFSLALMGLGLAGISVAGRRK